MSESSREKKIKNLISKDKFKDKTYIAKYTTILKFLYKENEDEFEKLTKIEGNKRRFIFDPSKSNKNKEGSRPRRLEGTPYCVISRINNKTKKKVLKEALDILGYSESVASMVTELID